MKLTSPKVTHIVRAMDEMQMGLHGKGLIDMWPMSWLPYGLRRGLSWLASSGTPQGGAFCRLGTVCCS